MLLSFLRREGFSTQAIGCTTNYQGSKTRIKDGNGSRKDFDLAIFDMDGTLYRFGDSEDGSIFKTAFYREVEQRGIRFIAEALSVPIAVAAEIRTDIFKRYNGDLSIGLEREKGLDRIDYFENVWNIDPSKYLNSDPELAEMLSNMNCKKALLTAAPRAWAENVMKYLGIYGLFDGFWFGEGPIRKPARLAYREVLDFFGSEPERTLVIDDEAKCLETAKSLGLKTMLRGSGKEEYIDYAFVNLCDMKGICG